MDRTRVPDRVDANGSGLTSTRLHDSEGRFGIASQILFVDRA
jgi:hypothetical protein